MATKTAHSPRPLQIAIDGPVAAGKGDIASRLASELGLVYIYTGAMYRVLALACIREGVPFKNADRVLGVLGHISVELSQPARGSGRSFSALLNGKDVTERIFEQDVAMGSSDVSVIPEVRRIMVERQRQMAAGKPVVMEGRDIGLKVLPDAQLKIYLTASLDERARRRFRQWQEKGTHKSFEETLADTKERDLQDTTRKTDPLMKLPDAWELDTTDMSQDQVVDAVRKELKKRNLL